MKTLQQAVNEISALHDEAIENKSYGAEYAYKNALEILDKVDSI